MKNTYVDLGLSLIQKDENHKVILKSKKKIGN